MTCISPLCFAAGNDAEKGMQLERKGAHQSQVTDDFPYIRS